MLTTGSSEHLSLRAEESGPDDDGDYYGSTRLSTISTNLHSRTHTSILLHKLNVIVIAEGTREAPKMPDVSASNRDSAAEMTLYTMMLLMMLLLAGDGR